jgi:hypothetical protein
MDLQIRLFRTNFRGLKYLLNRRSGWRLWRLCDERLPSTVIFVFDQSIAQVIASLRSSRCQQSSKRPAHQQARRWLSRCLGKLLFMFKVCLLRRWQSSATSASSRRKLISVSHFGQARLRRNNRYRNTTLALVPVCWEDHLLGIEGRSSCFTRNSSGGWQAQELLLQTSLTPTTHTVLPYELVNA